MSDDEARTIPGCPGYSVTQDGRVRGKRGSWLQPAPQTAGGHLRFCAYDKGKSRFIAVHRAVLLAWIGPCPDGLEGCHRDGDVTNNHVSNLRWDTHAANMRDAVRQERFDNQGIKNPAVKLTEADVVEIRRQIERGIFQTRIAERFGVQPPAITKIKLRQTWSHLG